MSEELVIVLVDTVCIIVSLFIVKTVVPRRIKKDSGRKK